jgi:hypothetical protein
MKYLMNHLGLMSFLLGVMSAGGVSTAQAQSNLEIPMQNVDGVKVLPFDAVEKSKWTNNNDESVNFLKKDTDAVDSKFKKGPPFKSAKTQDSTQNFDIEAKSAQIAQEIRQNGRYLSLDQRNRISTQLDGIRDIIYGGNSTPALIACVTRDNDGRDPWILAVREGINVRRIAGTVFANQAECESGMQTIRSIGTTSLMCVSRDNDGKNPYTLATFNASTPGAYTASKLGAVMPDMQSCVGTIRRAVIRQNLTLLCVSRDNDGRAPWIAASLDSRSGQFQRGTEAYNTIDVCWASLGI